MPSAAHLLAAVPADGGATHVFGLTSRQLTDFVIRPGRIVAIIVIALIVRLIIGRAISRFVRSTQEGRLSRRLAVLGEHAPLLVDTSDLAVGRRRARAATIGSVLRSVSNVIILVIAVATVLGQLGINLAPVIASAGIVGVAVGFGAQNLVKDFLSGLFLVIEDTFGVGDTVDLGPATGTVEQIGLRSTRIRDVHGTLWSVRNGEIVRVANYTQAWQRALFDVLVLPNQSIADARTAMLAAAAEVTAREGNAGVVLDPPAVWGVNDIRTDGVIVRLAVRRRPNNDAYDRELREALVAALAAAGVRIFLLPADIRLTTGEGGALATLDLGRPKP